MQRNLIFFVIALWAMSAAARADSLSEPPQAWREQVTAIPGVYVAKDDAATFAVLDSTRRELASLLETSPPVSAERLGDAYGRLGALYHVQAVAGPAELCYHNAVTLSPDNFRWHYYAGELMRDRGRYREALQQFAAARVLDADYPPLRLRIAQARYELGELEQAQRDLEAIQKAPGLEAMASYQLGRIALLRKESSAALRHFRHALELDPDAQRVHYPLAQALRALGENEQARSHLARHGKALPSVKDPVNDELWALRSGPRTRFIHAMQSVQAGEYAVAVEDFEQGLAGDPDNARARASYARALYLNGNGEGSKNQLERSLELQPGYPLAVFLLGLLADESGDGAAAEQYYLRTLELDAGHSGARLYLAGLLYRDGRYAESARHYEQADHDIPFAPLMQVLAAARAGTPQAGSVASLQGLLQSRPDDPMPRYALARLLALAGDEAVRDPGRALELARELVRRHPAPPFQALLALCLASSGDFEQAELQLQQLEFMPPWMSGVDLEGLKSDLAALKRGEMPGQVWPPMDPLLQPPPTRAGGPMREYPVELPY